jgi:hypothetical protein
MRNNTEVKIVSNNPIAIALALHSYGRLWLQSFSCNCTPYRLSEDEPTITHGELRCDYVEDVFALNVSGHSATFTEAKS